MSRSDWLADTPALTLLNPWAHLVAHHGKDVENRGWVPRRPLNRLLIHAGKGWDSDAEGVLRDRGIAVDGLTVSAIVAVVVVGAVCSAMIDTPGVRCGCGPWAAAGRYHWRLWSVVPLVAPVPASGRLGLWHPSAEVVEAVAAQIPVGVS